MREREQGNVGTKGLGVRIDLKEYGLNDDVEEMIERIMYERR